MLNVSTTKITIVDETRECLSRQMVLVLCKYQITAVIMSWMARPKCHLFFFSGVSWTLQYTVKRLTQV